jgi:hypothetical protein
VLAIENFEEKVIPKPVEKKDPSTTNDRCGWRDSPATNTTFEVTFFIFIKYPHHFFFVIKIRQLYETLPFDDQDGGSWKQGFKIEYDPSQWTSEKKLKVILMPHSHCDPGKNPKTPDLD